jgi:hypothetical protein
MENPKSETRNSKQDKELLLLFYSCLDLEYLVIGICLGFGALRFGIYLYALAAL